MTEEEAIKRLNELEGGDAESAHLEADDILCEYLKMNGSPRIAEAFENASGCIGFRYA